MGAPSVIALATLAWIPGVSAAEPAVAPNLLDRPMVDVATLPDPDPTTTPMLVTLESPATAASTATASTPASVARLAVLRRDAQWVDVADRDVELGGTAGLEARWLVTLGDGRFALIATSPRAATGEGRAVVVGLDVVRDGGTVAIEETDRQVLDRAIDAAGAADVDGFGSAELVLGLRPTFDSGGCATSTLIVVDGSVAAIRRSIELPGHLGAGVIGRFDTKAGDDLLVYDTEGCAPGTAPESRLLAVRLSDGSQSLALPAFLHGDVETFPAPLRLDLDGRSPDEVIATTRDGLSILDPSRSWRPLLVAAAGSVPLVAGATSGSAKGGDRVALLDGAGTGAIVAATVRRDRNGGLAWEGRSALAADVLGEQRWDMVENSIREAVARQDPSNAWLGDAVKVGCPDLVVPAAILPCATDELRAGAAWLATRPLAAVPIDGQRTMLIAAGLAWDPDGGLPHSPTPALGAPAGWWRHGPSVPFAISEIRSADLVYFREFPTPAATIETTLAHDGTTTLPGFTGARLFARADPLADGQEPEPQSGDAAEALRSRPRPDGRAAVARVPVPAGLESGRDGSYASLGIGDLQPASGTSTGRWSIEVVPINDWGEWGQPASRLITRDAVGPTVAVEEPFTSPVWPFFAHLAGRSEPGSSVRVDGIGEMEVDRRGRFAVETQLAPWPQVIRVTATDPAGNVTVGEFSIVGGIDYRRFPWPGIGAALLLLIVTARGLFGSGRARATGVEATAWSTGAFDEASTPEIEELPPGSGLARS